MNEAHSSVDRERKIHEENRKLKHEIDELKAKYKTETLENKIKTLAMQNEIVNLKSQQKTNDTDSQMVKKIETLKNQIEDLEIEKGELETSVQTLRDEFELMKAEVRVEDGQKAMKKVVQEPMGEIPDRFFKGAEKFLTNYNAEGGDFFR